MWRTSLRTAAAAGLIGWLAAAAVQPAAAADVVRVGEGPFITGGGFYVANERGYFKKWAWISRLYQYDRLLCGVPVSAPVTADTRRHSAA